MVGLYGMCSKMSRVLLALGWVLLGTPLPADAQANSWKAPRYLVFGNAPQWFLFEVHSRKLEPLSFPEPFRPEGIDVSRDGLILYFTAYDSKARNTLLFSWVRGSQTPPASVGNTRGYHSDPALSPDGRWLYFAHNPDARGPPGKHTSKAYAQLYRVRTDGTGLEALSAEDGCHFAPTVARGESVFLVHTTCSFERWLVRYDLRTRKARRLDEQFAIFDEPTASPDGERLLFAVTVPAGIELREQRVRGGQPKTLLTVPVDMPRIRPRYGSRPQEILYQYQQALWSFDGERSTQLGKLSLETP